MDSIRLTHNTGATVGRSFRSPDAGTLGAIVRAFRSAVTRRVNVLRQTPGRAVWQRSFYEHVIRDEDELRRVRTYIAGNPRRWEIDRENPDRIAELQ